MSSEEFVESNQKFAVNLAFGLLAWIFSVFVFLPLIRLYAAEWASLIAVLLVVDISYYLVVAKMHSSPLFEYVSNRIAGFYIGWRKLGEDSRPLVWRRTKKALGIGLILVVYLMYRPLLWVVSPVLAGIAFIMVLLMMLKQVLVN